MIRLWDTMERRKKEFAPPDPNRITMYVCGPTVYGRAHIGNARPAVVFDTLARLIRYQYGADSLTYARNVTDVDDKIIAAAEAEGVTTRAISVRYEKFYLDDMGALNVAPPDFAPHATAFVPRMIDMISRLLVTGVAYEAEGHVLFDVAKDPEYGALSQQSLESLVAGSRVEPAPYKRGKLDFVLWKPSSPEVIGWDSPWGRGRPGWHIECSAMIENWFGDVQGIDTIDIHGGGQDLIFPHHENELAQSRCVHGRAPLARHWVHNGFVDMGAEKMSKSLGNVVTVEELLKQGHKGETLRLALLSAHYRSPLPWTANVLKQSKASLDRWYRALDRFALDYDVHEYDPHPDVVEALSDDLNTPAALGAVAVGLRASSVEPGEAFTISAETGAWLAAAKFLGFLSESPTIWFQGDGDHSSIKQRIAERAAAKAARDFATADRIRAELAAEGILLEDGPNGTTWRRA